MRKFIIVNGETICKSRDDESRPRKRQRIDSDDELDSHATYCLPKGPLVRDEEFYKEEADCIIQVENSLFKVHVSLLSSSILGDMLRHHTEETGDTSDANPLVLPASTSVEEFRSLLWALYADSQEIQAQTANDDDVNRLLSIAAITYEYHFLPLQSWTWATIEQVTSHEVYVECCSSAIFARTIDVAIFCKKMDLLDSIISKWSDRIRRRAAPSVPAILVADKHELPSLRGVAYHVYIQEMIENQTTVTDRGANQFHVDPKLSNGQVMRLLSGYWSLVSFWERLRRSPPKFLRSGECTGETHRICVDTWESRWQDVARSSKILKYSSADVLSILSCMRDQLSADQELTHLVKAQCRVLALASLEQIFDDFYGGLDDHFFGCI